MTDRLDRAIGLVGPDGKPLYPRVEMRDQGLTYTTRPGESYQAKPQEILMAMARRQRDGASHKAIIAEFDLVGDATSPFVLERALAAGRALLDAAIARGEVPAETMIPVLVDDEDDDE